MPTPIDHRDITVVVQPPRSTSSVSYELVYGSGQTIDSGQVTLRQEQALDERNADTTYRQLTVVDDGEEVLDVRTMLSVVVEVGPGQTSTKTVVEGGCHELHPGKPQRPAPGTERHLWIADGRTVELTVEATAGGAAAAVGLYPQSDGTWGIVVMRESDQKVLAYGSISMPSTVVEPYRLAETG